MLNKQVMGAVLLLLVGVASYFILKPFVLAILSASIFAVLFRPIYNWLHKYVKSPNACASIISILALLIVIVPVWFVSQTVFVEMAGIMQEINSQNISSTQVSNVIESIGQNIIGSIPGINAIELKSISIELLKSATNWAKKEIFSIPTKILLLFLGVFLFYYLLRDGDKFVKWLYAGLPISKKNQLLIDSRLRSMTYAVVYGQIVTAILQGAVAMFGYWIFGMNAPVLWGLATMLFSLVPFVGTAIIWLPASIYLFVHGLAINSWWAGVGLFVYGIIIIGMVDNVLKPFLIGASSGTHHAVALIGVIGGIYTLGFIGVFAGPLILSLFISLYDVLVLKQKT